MLAGCGGSDADVAGNYTMALTNRDNGCNFMNYDVGAQGMAAVVITQDGSAVTATVTGLAAFPLTALVGSNVFAGAVDGDDVDLEIIGDNAFTMGNRAYTFNAEIKATASGDSMSGRIEYRAATNGNPDCGALTGCLTYQDFAGSRPPP